MGQSTGQWVSAVVRILLLCLSLYLCLDFMFSVGGVHTGASIGVLCGAVALTVGVFLVVYFVVAERRCETCGSVVSRLHVKPN